MHDKNGFPREGTISHYLLELTAVCGEFSLPLLLRIPGSTSYKESVITSLKKGGFLRTAVLFSIYDGGICGVL